MSKSTRPTAEAVKERLWLAMEGVQTGTMSTDTANSIAGIARAIVQTVKVELEIRKQLVQPVSPKTAAFVE
jgi:hypothetical protein